MTATASKIFSAIKNGSLMEELGNFDNDSLKNFLPCLMLASFPTTLETAVELDILQSRLVEISAGNQFIRFMRLDFAQIEQKCMKFWQNASLSTSTQCAATASGSFVQKSCEEKVLAVCFHLISRSQRDFSPAENKPETFECFDVGHYHEEAVWALSLASFFMPKLFNLVTFARYMLSYQSGPQLIYLLLLNQPDAFDALVEDLLSLNCSDENDFVAKQRRDALVKLFALEPEQAERYLTAMLDTSLPSRLAMAINFICSDLFSAEFFVDTLISHFIKRDNMLTVFVMRNSRTSLRKVCERIDEIISTLERNSSELNERMLLLMALLCSHSSLRLSTDECHQWVYYITHQPTATLHTSMTANFLSSTPLSTASIHKMTLAVILACPNLTPNQQAFRDELVENYLIDYFQSIRELAGSTNDVTENNSSTWYDSLSRMMLLVAIHMSTNKGDELANLVSSVLGFKVGDTLRKLSTVCTLYLRHAVTERDIAEKAARLGVTHSLNAKSSGYLPVHCIDHLLSSRTFSKHQIPIQEWIKRQMLECIAPVHPIMTNLLKNFSISCVPTSEHEFFNTAIDEQFFWDIFSTDIFEFHNNKKQTSPVVQLLALFYLISYTFKLQTFSPASITAATAVAKRNNSGALKQQQAPQPYSQQLWARIPIRYLLLVLDVRHEDYAAFRPILLRFIAAIMPHMLPNINSTLYSIDTQIASYNDFALTSREKSGVSVEMFYETLRNFSANISTMVAANNSCSRGASTANGSSFMDALSRIDLAPIHEQYRHCSTIVEAMEVTLAPETPRHVADKVVRVWQRLENLIPRRLYEATLQRWLSGPHAAVSGFAGKSGKIQVDNELLLAETPLILFRVDERVFKSPPHLRCLMHMLSFYLDANKNANNLRLLRSSAVTQSKLEQSEKEQLYKSLIGTQYLAVVQLLLELCDQQDNSCNDMNTSRSQLNSRHGTIDVNNENGNSTSELLAEIREICCAQIHQMFIADSLLPKLVHFNMYSLRLIPLMVRGVPSAHILIGFLGDLLAGANLERRIFGICLMAELIEQYKIPVAFAGVGFISDVLDTLLACSVDDEHIVLFIHITSALARLAKVSAFHAAAILETMNRMRRIALARLALYTSVVAARNSQEQRLVDVLEDALASCRGASCTVATTTVNATTKVINEATAVSCVGTGTAESFMSTGLNAGAL